MTSANVVTLGRILLVPLLLVVLLRAPHNDFNRYLGAGILLIIGLSDVLDGYLARNRKEITLLGKYLDPVADKLVVVVLCLFLISSSWPGPHLPLWLVGLILGRDALVLLATVLLSLLLKQWQPCPDLFGRGNNLIQLVTFGMVIVGNVMPGPIVGFFLWLAALSTIVSSLSYLWWGVGLMGSGWKLERST
jgi:CDP-diacylglycerol--glycerol-3-phosphate 3-phosphatidyltransferase